MRARTAWEALTTPVRVFLTSRWPWRAALYLLTGTLLGGVVFVVFYFLFLSVVITLVYVVGALLLAGFVLAGLLVSRLERRRLRIIDDNPIENPHRTPDHPGWRSWVWTRVREPITWRELAFTLVSAVALWWIDAVFLALGLFPIALTVGGVITVAAGTTGDDVWASLLVALVGLVLFPVMAYPVTAWAAARAEITRAVVAPKETELGRRLTAVTSSRARLVDAFEVERRRIERDLHDGTQQRLVALGVELGLAKLDLPKDSETYARVDAAQRQATEALQELRELVRGVYPQLLVERGLEAAAEDLAGRTPVPITVEVALPRRLPPAVETTTYFAISEALANVAKHAAAEHGSVKVRLETDVLVAEVTDDGAGGADPEQGSGLSGLVDRLAVLDGRLFVSSPPGGPTVVRIEVPCGQQEETHDQ